MSGQDAFTREAMDFLSLTSLYVPFNFANQPMMKCSQYCSRHIPAFFLGGVLIFALRSIMSSSLLERYTVLRPSNLFPPDPETISQEKAYTVRTGSTSMSTSPHDHRGLFFFLYLCFISASITFFASVLTFSPNTEGACGTNHSLFGETSSLAFNSIRRRLVWHYISGISHSWACYFILGLAPTRCSGWRIHHLSLLPRYWNRY
jgi:hypothetical protein